MSSKVDATYHPRHHCISCDREHGSKAAADRCALEDMAEDDRARRNIGRSSD